MEVMNNNYDSLSNQIQRKQHMFERKRGEINYRQKIESEDRSMRKSI